MKTRSNMPLFVVETNDVKALSNSQIDLLRCGDYLVKKDASGEHAYKVTFKSDTGMCITYMDAYCVETQSYDKVDGNWVYNSEDKTIIAEPQMENIVDAQGHKRFIEGDINIESIDGVTKGYGKWSLSGSHLMIVLACSVANETELISQSKICDIALPDWILNKIVAISGNVVDTQNVPMYASNFSTQILGVNAVKVTSYLRLNVGSSVTLTADRTFRYSLDLLIDND